LPRTDPLFTFRVSNLNRTIMKTPKLFFAAALAVLLFDSCYQTQVQLPNPILQSVVRFPFQNYLDSLFSQSRDSIILTIGVTEPYDPLTTQNEVFGQAEIAYAFRTSAPAAVAELALYLPSGGDTHLVTLWDSASGTVLAYANITMVDSAQWNSVPVTGPGGQIVTLQPGRGYIIGFNSLANGDALDGTVYNPDNSVYVLYGIYDFEAAVQNTIPVIPFTKGLITYEGVWNVFYDTELAELFPGNSPSTSNVNGVYGVCDIGYIAGP
jgi:hypothetical protein